MVHLRIWAPWKRKIIFQDSLFSGSMLNFGGVSDCAVPVRPSVFSWPKQFQVQLWIFFFDPLLLPLRRGNNITYKLEEKVVHTSPFTDITISANSFFKWGNLSKFFPIWTLFYYYFCPFQSSNSWDDVSYCSKRLKTWTFHGKENSFLSFLLRILGLGGLTKPCQQVVSVKFQRWTFGCFQK